MVNHSSAFYYYYKKKKILLNPQPQSPTEVDWTIGKFSEIKQEENAGIDREISNLRDEQWLKHLKERLKE